MTEPTATTSGAPLLHPNTDASNMDHPHDHDPDPRSETTPELPMHADLIFEDPEPEPLTGTRRSVTWYLPMTVRRT